MIKRITLFTVIMMVMVYGLFAEKSLERLGNEAEVAADKLFSAEKRAEAAEQYNEALAKFKAANEKDGIPVQDKIDRILDKLFKAYYFSKTYTKAIEILQRQLKSDPGNTKKARTIAQIYEKNLKDLDSAINTLVSFNETKKSYVVQKKIASYYTDKKDYENALTWYKNAYKIKQDSKVIKNIAVILNKYLGRNEEAIKAYEEYVQTNPPQSAIISTYKNMGALYEDMNNHSKANYYFEKVLELKYDSNINLKLIGNYFSNDLNNKCLEKIEQLLNNKSGNIDAIYYRALIRYNQGDKIKAKEDFQKLLGSKYDKEADGYIESIDSE